MKKLVTCIMLMGIISSVFAIDELWQKAQKISQNSWRLVPGKTTERLKMIDPKKNEIQSNEEIIVKHSLGNNKNVLNKLVLATKNGEALDPEEKRVKKILSKDNTPKKKGVFFETNPKYFKVKRLDEIKEINGKKCQAYEIEYIADGDKDKALKGKIYLDIITGSPVLSELQLVNTPMSVENVDMVTHYNFDNKKNQVYVSKKEIHTLVSMFFVKAKMEGIVLMEDYWEYP